MRRASAAERSGLAIRSPEPWTIRIRLPARPVGASRRRHPGRQSNGADHLGPARGQQRRSTAEGMADQADRPGAAGPRGQLLDRPLDVHHRRVVCVPAAAGVQQAVHGEPAASGSRDPLRDRDHPQHRQLRRADHHLSAPARPAMEDEDGALSVVGVGDVDQAWLEFHRRPLPAELPATRCTIESSGFGRHRHSSVPEIEHEFSETPHPHGVPEGGLGLEPRQLVPAAASRARETDETSGD